MVSKAYTVAFQGVDARIVEVQCALAPGVPAFSIVGLPDKAVSEARERVRAAFAALSLALPAKRITINMSPADLPKEGSHYDLPIALALLAAIGAVGDEETARSVSLGELSLDGTLIGVPGALPAAMAAATGQYRLICPESSGAEAAWVDDLEVIAPPSLLATLQHLNGQRILEPAKPGEVSVAGSPRDLADVKGQSRAKRALEIAAAGRHHFFMVGAPGAGKSMLAARMPGILPPLSPEEALETSMIHSLAGLLKDGGISRSRPFRTPHHTASMAAIVGGGRGAGPGEISLAHHGVLFLDEFPEFPRMVLETLRQPIETGDVVVARANAHVRYPCKFLLVAAANPCRCGYLSDANRACNKAPACGEDYIGRISGPMIDRFDLRLDVPALAISDLAGREAGESSADVASRVFRAREIQSQRFASVAGAMVNADAEGAMLDEMAPLDTEGRDLLHRAADRFGLSARGFHRVQRVARTIADLEEAADIAAPHVAEALSFRLASGSGQAIARPFSSQSASARSA